MRHFPFVRLYVTKPKLLGNENAPALTHLLRHAFHLTCDQVFNGHVGQGQRPFGSRSNNNSKERWMGSQQQREVVGHLVQIMAVLLRFHSIGDHSQTCQGLPSGWSETYMSVARCVQFVH